MVMQREVWLEAQLQEVVSLCAERGEREGGRVTTTQLVHDLKVIVTISPGKLEGGRKGRREGGREEGREGGEGGREEGKERGREGGREEGRREERKEEGMDGGRREGE